MPRHMSFFMTTEQMRAGSKTVTRRFGWWTLKPGAILLAVEKSQGLRKGEKVQPIGLIRVVSVRGEQLHDIIDQPDDLAREGFPDITGQQFVDMLTRHYGCTRDAIINRIEFEHMTLTPVGLVAAQ